MEETPEDVATLYSWANLHGAKYRDFSAARAQTREKTRLRLQQVIEDEQARAQQTGIDRSFEVQSLADLERAAEIRRLTEAKRAEEEAHIAEQAAREAAQEAARQVEERAAQELARRAAQQNAEQAAQKAAERAAQHAAEQAAREAAERAAQQLAAQQAALKAQAAQDAAQRATELAAQQAEQQAARQAAERAAQQLAAQRAALQAQAAQDAAQRAAELAAQQAEQQAARSAAERAAQQQAARRAAEEAAKRAEWQPPLVDRLSSIPAADSAAPTAPSSAPQYQPKLDTPFYAQPQPPPQPAPMGEESHRPDQSPWAPVDLHENARRPACRTHDRADASRHQPVPPAPEDTLQGSRDRLTSRWFALRGMFEGTGAAVEAAPAPLPARAPVVAVFSLAGGVGKTSLVASLGRALSGRGERVLLVDTAPYGLLPFFFGARDQRPGLLRTFSPPGTSGDAPIQMVTIDPEGLGPDAAGQDSLTGEISTYSRGVSRVIVDLATASGATTRRVLRLSPLVLVPLVPDMNSVVSFSSIDSFFQHNGNGSVKPSLPYYVLNQFDSSLPLHLDIREVLSEQLGDRLLPFVLRRSPAVSEALAEGMTVMDYAPNSTIAEDFGSLAGWVKSQSAPASSAYRGVRWSER